MDLRGDQIYRQNLGRLWDIKEKVGSSGIAERLIQVMSSDLTLTLGPKKTRSRG